MGLALAATLGAAPAPAAPVSRNVALLAHVDEYGAQGLYSACWGYVHPDGREYAVIGHETGTAIYNITDPSSPYRVGFIPGGLSLWREMKQYRTWIYVSTEAPSGLQIVNMANPDQPVLATTYNLTFNQAHTVTIDTARALLFANGTRLDSANPNDRGMRILSLANPQNPVEVGFYNPDPANFADDWYVHDSHVVGTRVYLSCIFGGFVRVLETADPAAPQEIASWTYPGAFTHNAWTTGDGRHLFVTDEVRGEPLKVFDISNLSSPLLVGAVTSNPDAIVHNVHVKGDTAFASNYSEGVRLLDVTDPTTPAEFGYYDTFPGKPTSVFDGCWEVAPYFPSGVIIASDRQTGLYVLRSSPVYGTFKLKVRDAATLQPIEGARVRLAVAGDSLRTPAHGNVRFAPSPGYDVAEVTKFGYGTAQVAFLVLAGGADSATVLLTRLPTSSLSGTITADATGLPLAAAEVSVAYTPLDTVTSASGAYSFPAVPSGLAPLVVARPGYASATRWVYLPGNSAETQDVSLLKAAFYDSCDADLGWSLGAPGDDATGGRWLRADPVGVTVGLAAASRAEALRPLHPEPEEGLATDSQPEDDHSPAPSTFCFVTGNGTPGGAPGQADVDGGKTTLISPALDLSGMTDPVVGFWRWFYTNAGYPDHFVVDVSPDNGLTWVNAESLTVSHPEWHAEEIHVRDFVTPGPAVRLRFVVADLGAGSVVEGLVDDVAAYDAALVPLSVGSRTRALALGAAWPNPARGAQRITLILPTSGPVEVAVVDVSGRVVRTLHRGWTAAGTLTLAWDGRDQGGRESPAGLYWARARGAAGEAARKLVRVR